VWLCTVSIKGKTWTYLQIVLKVNLHLSYPHIMEYEGTIYMMPQGHTMTLYKCTSFPTKWTHVKHLLSIKNPLVDITTVHYQDRWWAFGLQTGSGKAYWRLHIYYADKLTGPWLPTPNNCYAGVRGSTCVGGENVTAYHKGGSKHVRPGGRMFVEDGKLYRMVQDSIRRYGDDLNLFEVTNLTTYGLLEEKLVPSFRMSLRAKTNIEVWNRKRYHHADLHKIPGNDGAPDRWVMLTDGDFNGGEYVAPKKYKVERCADVRGAYEIL
jgi:hypothetical protein